MVISLCGERILEKLIHDTAIPYGVAKLSNQNAAWM